VGGKTKGRVTIALMGARHLERVWDNHHAIGVATNKRMIVVSAASLSVKPMACQVSGVMGLVIVGKL
jgi:hypothetical protein